MAEPILVLICATIRALVCTESALGLSPEHSSEAEAVWQLGQRARAQVSTQRNLLVAEQSGHDIPREHPDLVVEVIQEVTNQARE